jgi:hypothetical protein
VSRKEEKLYLNIQLRLKREPKAERTIFEHWTAVNPAVHVPHSAKFHRFPFVETSRGQFTGLADHSSVYTVTLFRIFRVQLPPTCAQSDQGRNGKSTGRDCKDDFEACHVRGDYSRYLGSGECGTNLSGTSKENRCWINVWNG